MDSLRSRAARCAVPAWVSVVSPDSSPGSPGASSATSASDVPSEVLSDACASPGLASVAMRASTTPTSTVVPTSTRISCTRPLAGASTSVSILSVEMDAMISSRSTQSPARFFHSTTVPSATETPIWGIVTSTVPVSVGEELTARLLDVVDLREHGLLERGGERDRDIGRAHAHHGAVEVLPPALRDQRRHLRAGGAHRVCLVDDDHLRGLAHGGEDRVLVERDERAQVEHLDRGAVEILRRLERRVHHHAVGDHGEVLALAREPGAERRLVCALRDVALDAAVEVLVLHEHDGV